MFTLAISCLTTSNLPWFVDLIFQVLMQYCSLKNWTLLPPPVTFTTGHFFLFGSVRGMCNFLSSISSQQKFEVTDVKALGASQLSESVTAPCYSYFILENKGKCILKVWEHANPKDSKRREGKRERETPGPLALLFICFFLPLGLLYVIWASQECCLFYLRSSLRSLGPPLLYFHGLFPSLSFSHHPSGLIFPFLTT